MTEAICPKCYGSGCLEMERTHMGIPVTTPCTCLIAKDIIRNLNRAWSGLSSATKVDSSPLTNRVDDYLYITANDLLLRSHLRHVGIRMGRFWGFKVVSDSDLMTAWLAPVGLLGKEILDPDAAVVSTENATLVDLIDPPDLLIVRLGVKAARNRAMNEVFLETLLHRKHTGKPLWVVDQPDRKLDATHMCFSGEVLSVLSTWDHITLGTPPPKSFTFPLVNQPPLGHIHQESTEGGEPEVTNEAPQMVGSMGATRTFEMPVPRQKKPKYKNKGDR